MGEMVLKNVKCYVGGYDLSGTYNQCKLSQNADLVDKTAFGSSARKRAAGLKDVELTVGGFYNPSSSKQNAHVHFLNVGCTGKEITVVPQGTGLGNIAYFSNACQSEYSAGGNIGEMLGFNVVAYGYGAPLIRGQVAEQGLMGTTTPVVTPVSLGFRSTNQRLYAAHHCLTMSSSGHKITASIQISSASGFAAITTALKFNQTTIANRSEFKSTACSTAKQWYRAKITGSAAAVRANMMVTFGLQKKFN